MANQLWYRQPATTFDEALPIGCGRLGAMLYGGVETECCNLNEDSVWSGGMLHRINPNALANLQTVRSNILSGEIAAAEQLAFQTMQGCGPDMTHYLSLANLSVTWKLPAGTVTDYTRTLDLNTATQTTTFCINGVRYTRTWIASAPAQVLALRLSVSSGATVSCSVSLNGRIEGSCSQIVPSDGGSRLLHTGSMSGKNGIAFAAVLQIGETDGVQTAVDNSLCVQNASFVTILFGARTSYYHPTADYTALAYADTAQAAKQTWSALLAAHLNDYQRLFQRVTLNIPNEVPTDLSAQPTDLRREALQNGDTSDCNALLCLYFQYGRYLMIAGSRAGSLPLNLQGIWNQDLTPAWGSRFTININTQMNYWPAESCNLSECHTPLFDLIETMRPQGRVVAKKMYGCAGFCCHHNTDLWGDCAPQDLWMPATIWPMGAAWLCLHLYEHFMYTNDLQFLKEKYPTLREAACFFTDYLIPDGKGHLVTCPSVSPENTYRLPNGEQGNLCAAPSMDTTIITVLFQAVADAATRLQVDEAFVSTLQTMLVQLPPLRIGSFGQIMEWATDVEEVEPGHRHISQLFALHPAHLISPRKTPLLANAARVTIQRRLSHGGGHTGWSRAWIANMWARLGDGEQVLEHLTKLLQNSTNPNLLDMHPPFQIDGNFGGTAAIAEALLQSAPDGMTLLPACPSHWQSGTVEGLRAYGGFSVSIAWEAQRLTTATIHADCDGVCRLFTDCAIAVTSPYSAPIPLRKEADGAVCFDTVSDGIYHIAACAV